MDTRSVYFLAAALGIVQCELINLKCHGIKIIVDGHNSRRLQLAKGQVSGQPAASKMNFIIWDAELATKASKWASNNEFQHNPDLKIPSQRFTTADNIYLFGTINKINILTAEEAASFAMGSWFDEHKQFHYKVLKSSDFGTGQPIGHYTQMVWSDSTYLGCGISHFKKNEWNYLLVVCNYGPRGNYIGQAPYKNGTASGQLTCSINDCSRLYGDSC